MSKTINTGELKQALFALNVRSVNKEFGEQDDLISMGVVDSYTIVQLVVALEERLEIVFDYADLKAEHFKTLLAIENLLITKYGCTRATQEAKPVPV